jgi:hypothetical protein
MACSSCGTASAGLLVGLHRHEVGELNRHIPAISIRPAVTLIRRVGKVSFQTSLPRKTATVATKNTICRSVRANKSGTGRPAIVRRRRAA